MGHGLSCAGSTRDRDFFASVRAGHLESVRTAVQQDPSLLLRATFFDRLSALHIAAANGHVQVLQNIPLFPRVSLRHVSCVCLGIIIIQGVWKTLQILSMILEKSSNPDIVNRRKQVLRFFFFNLKKDTAF